MSGSPDPNIPSEEVGLRLCKMERDNLVLCEVVQTGRDTSQDVRDELLLGAAARIEALERDKAALEQLRSVWAGGYTSDSVAAQVCAASLSQIWAALGAKSQTEAMAKLVSGINVTLTQEQIFGAQVFSPGRYRVARIDEPECDVLF